MPYVNEFFTWRNYFRMLAYGYSVAVLIVVVMNIGNPVNVPRTVFSVVVIGLCLNTTIWAFEFLFRHQIQ